MPRPGSTRHAMCDEAAVRNVALRDLVEIATFMPRFWAGAPARSIITLLGIVLTLEATDSTVEGS